MKQKIVYTRECSKCHNFFKTEKKTRKHRVCPDCIIKKFKEEYNFLIKEIEKAREDATLSKWKILSRAYVLGKRIWGIEFSRKRLSQDMSIPFSTVTRCLALDRATEKSMELMKSGKISASRLSMICQTKNIKFQDEIVDAVIKDNLTTYQIKRLKVNNIEDMNKERHKIAVENGYTTAESATRNFLNWISRGKLFLLMKKTHLQSHRKYDVIEELIKLRKIIDAYVGDVVK